MDNQTAIENLVQKLIDLQTNLAAMTSVLQNSEIRNKATGTVVPWEDAFAEHHARVSDPVWYEDIQNKVKSSNLQFPELIRLLNKLADRSIPTR